MFSGIEFTDANYLSMDTNTPDYHTIHENLKRKHDEMSAAHENAHIIGKQQSDAVEMFQFITPLQMPLPDFPSDLHALQIAIAIEYLSSPFNDQSIQISHPKYALKSYNLNGKKENRLISPPPRVTLIGNAWKLSTSSPYPVNVAVKIPLETPQDTLVQHRPAKKVKHAVYSGTSCIKHMPLDSFNVSLRDCASHTTNAASQTSGLIHQTQFPDLSCHEEMTLDIDIVDSSNGTLMYSLSSQKIEALGKVSTAKSVNPEKAIRSGSTVTLINRTGGQHSKTRFLTAAKNGQSLQTSSDDWDEFIIWRVDDPSFNPNFRRNQSPIPLATANVALLSNKVRHAALQTWGRYEFDALRLKEKIEDPIVWMVPNGTTPIGPISSIIPLHRTVESCSMMRNVTPLTASATTSRRIPEPAKFVLRYGDRIFLQSARTGTISRALVIKHASFNTANHPVQNLAKIILELADKPNHYLTRRNESCGVSRDPTDIALYSWMIVPTVSTDFTFFIPKLNPIIFDSTYCLPTPAVQSIAAFGDFITLTGNGFSSSSMVMFGHIPSPSVEFVDVTTLLVKVPLLPTNARMGMRHDAFNVGVPLLIIRPDGILFRTGKYHSYF